VDDGDRRICDEMVVLDWHFYGHGVLSSASFEARDVPRPGRLLRHRPSRSLIREEAARLAGRLCNADPAREQAALVSAFAQGAKTASVAAIYRACADTAATTLA
jgi:hypothetical protein